MAKKKPSFTELTYQVVNESPQPLPFDEIMWRVQNITPITTAIFAFEAQSLEVCLKNLVFDLDSDLAKVVNSICAMGGWILQRQVMMSANDPNDPELAMMTHPQIARRDYGYDELAPFFLILPPGTDAGLDLAAFLGYLLGYLGVSADPIELLYDAKVYYQFPLVPGIGSLPPDVPAEEFKRSFDEWWNSIGHD